MVPRQKAIHFSPNKIPGQAQPLGAPPWVFRFECTKAVVPCFVYIQDI
jgi:hypothetical protein